MFGRHMLLPPLSITTSRGPDPPPCHTPPFFPLLPSAYPDHFDSGGLLFAYI